MTKPNFKLTLEPLLPEHKINFCSLDGSLGINVNGVEVFSSFEEGETTREQIIYPIRWLFENFRKYTSVGMPKETSPAVLLFEELEKTSEEYYREIKKSDGTLLGYVFPKEGKEDFGRWIKSHAFYYGYTEHPVIFQRRNTLMEISWRMPPSYRNPRGCEYVSLDDFKKEILTRTSETVQRIKDSGKVIDFVNYGPELKIH